MLQSMGSQRIGCDWATEQQHNFEMSLCMCVCVCIGAIIDNSNKIPCFTKQSSQKIISFLDERVINTHTGQGAIS